MSGYQTKAVERWIDAATAARPSGVDSEIRGRASGMRLVCHLLAHWMDEAGTEETPLPIGDSKIAIATGLDAREIPALIETLLRDGWLTVTASSLTRPTFYRYRAAVPERLDELARGQP